MIIETDRRAFMAYNILYRWIVIYFKYRISDKSKNGSDYKRMDSLQYVY